jgi:hypothetical protein
MAFSPRPSVVLRYLFPAILLTFTLYLLTGPHELASSLTRSTPWTTKHAPATHPIDKLIATAEKEFQAKLSKQTTTLPQAAAVYRIRRGRHPPPGFDKWHAFATEKDAIIVEDFWDQIYHDLEPFWALEPAQIRRDAEAFDMKIEIRNGKASTGSDWFWTLIWLDMIKSVEHLLPDMVLALNPMDEPRMVVPWEDVDGFVKVAGERRRMVGVEDVVEEFGRKKGVGKGNATEVVWESESRFVLDVGSFEEEK